MVTKTIGKLHFSDLDPGRFEMLCLDIIYRMRRWEKIDHYGAAGSDDGVDIQAVECLENGKRVVHHFQCKRYEKLTKAILLGIVNDYIAKQGESRPDYYYVVCGCTVSKKAEDAFEEYCAEKGFKNVAIWTASLLEAKLYSEYHDLLFAFFGINLSQNMNKRIQAIRRNVALKKRMHKDFYKPAKGEYIKGRRGPWDSFVDIDIIIRSIYDTSYPDVSPTGQGWFKTEVYDWYHNGLRVRIAPYGFTAKVKRLKPTAIPGSKDPEDYEIIEKELETVGCIPFDNIIEYDIEGDEYSRCPQLYCDYETGRDPFEAIEYYTRSGIKIDPAMIVEGIPY